MKLTSTLFALILSFIILRADAQNPKFWVMFKDKNQSVFSLSNPEQFLSARSVQRRQNQNIPIVQNDLPVNSWYIDSVKNLGGKVLYASKWFNAVAVECDTATLTKIKALPFVKSNRRVQRLKSTKDSKSFFAGETLSGPRAQQKRTSQNGLDYGNAYNQAHMLKADSLHSLGFKGEGMMIAILDAGFQNFDTLHAFDSLRTNNQILGWKDFVDFDGSVSEDDGHGTMVLSCIGANLPGTMIGTAPKANFWLLRTENAWTENEIEESNWVRGAEFADSVGADLINTSLGYTLFDSVQQGGSKVVNPSNHSYADMNGHTTLITKAGNIAASKGIFVEASAGNEGAGEWHYISAPADGDSVFATGAVNSIGEVAGFSSRGPASDGDVKPNAMAQGWNAYVQYPWGMFGSGSGTSFAGPVMTGAIACFWQQNPGKTNMEVFQAVQASCSLFPFYNDSMGYGIPDLIRAKEVILGIDSDNFDKIILNTYPNPFISGINIEIASGTAQTVKMMVFDILGKKILEGKYALASGQNRFTLEEIPSVGIYDVMILSENGKTVQHAKIIKQ